MKRIPLSFGKFALVDDEMFEELGQMRWGASPTTAGSREFYARGMVDGSHVLMHRYIMKPAARLVVDHINGDTLDNQRSNLRVCSRAVNNRNRIALNENNTSGASGVIWSKRDRKWVARIDWDGKRKELGRFLRIEDAVACRKTHLAQYELNSPNGSLLKAAHDLADDRTNGHLFEP